MKTGKYKAFFLAAVLVSALNYGDTKASTQVVILRPPYQNKEAKISNNQTINDLNETIKDMKYQLMCAQNEILRLQEMNQNLTKSLSAAEVNSRMTKKQNSSLERNITDNAKQIEEIPKQSDLKLNMNNNEIIDLKNQLFAQQKRNEDLSKTLANLNSEFNKVKQQYSSLNSQNGTNLAFKNIQIDSLKNQLINKEKQIQFLSDKINTLNNDIKKLKENYNLANSQSYETEINELKNQLAAYRTKSETLTSRIVNLNNELDKARQQYTSAHLGTNTISNDNSAEISFLKSKLAFTEKQVQDFSGKISVLQQELTESKKVFSLAVNRQKELENMVSLANKRADDIINEKNVQINKLKKDLADKTTVLTTAQKTVSDNTRQNFIKVDNKKSAEDYFNIAKAYQSAKDYKESINNYKNAIAVNSSFGSAYKELGLVYAQIGDYKNASYVLRQYLYYSTNPKEQEIIRNFLKNIEKCLNNR